MIKTAGANVAPREVEVAFESLPEVKHAFVLGLPDANRGQRVVAVLSLQEGESALAEDLRFRVRSDLAAYKVPQEVFLIPEDSLPFLDSGKIDKRSLETIVQEKRNPS